MTAFFIATTRIEDPEKFQEYAAKAAPTFAPFGGELVLRGKAENSPAGDPGHQAVGIVRFPSSEALDNWYRSAEYQKLIPLRDAAAEITFAFYSEPAGADPKP